MLESVRQNSRSAIVYILFGIIIVAFVISFGPGSPSGDSMPWSLSGRFAAHVYGNEVPEHDFHFAYLASGGGERSDRPEMASRSQRLKELVMDKLIERELLYREAEHGLAGIRGRGGHFVVYEGKMMVLACRGPSTAMPSGRRLRSAALQAGAAERLSRHREAVHGDPAP